MLLYLYSSTASAAAASAQTQGFPKEDELRNNLTKCWERSERATSFHPLIKQIFSQLKEGLGISIELSDLCSEEGHTRFAKEIYQLISNKYSNDFDLSYQEHDKVIGLERILKGCMKRQFVVQMAFEAHKLHGFEMTPLDNFLHDLFHIIAAKDYPFATQVMKSIYDDDTLKDNAEEKGLVTKLTTAFFLIMHEMFTFGGESLARVYEREYSTNLVEFLGSFESDVTQYFENQSSTKRYFSSEEIVQEIEAGHIGISRQIVDQSGGFITIKDSQQKKNLFLH